MLKRENLKPRQINAVEFIKKNRETGLFFRMGHGKTITVLTSIADMIEENVVNRVLIISPLAVARATWKPEIAKWEHTRHLTSYVCSASVNHKQRMIDLKTDKSQITIVNFEMLSWLVTSFFGKIPYDMLVVDELSKLKNVESKRSKYTFRILKSGVKKIVGLTGTPMPNGCIDVYGTTKSIFGDTLGEGIRNFKDAYIQKDTKSNKDKKDDSLDTEELAEVRSVDFYGMKEYYDRKEGRLTGKITENEKVFHKLIDTHREKVLCDPTENPDIFYEHKTEEIVLEEQDIREYELTEDKIRTEISEELIERIGKKVDIDKLKLTELIVYAFGSNDKEPKSELRNHLEYLLDKDYITESQYNYIRGQLIAFNFVYVNKVLKFTSGYLYSEEVELLEEDSRNIVIDKDRIGIYYHNYKLDKVMELVKHYSSINKNILILTNWASTNVMIEKLLPKAVHLTSKNALEISKEWNNGLIPIMFTNPASCGHGLNLQFGGHIIIWADMKWNLEEYQQANARLVREGQKDEVIIHDIVIKATMDDKVISKLRSKETKQDKYMEAIKTC